MIGTCSLGVLCIHLSPRKRIHCHLLSSQSIPAFVLYSLTSPHHSPFLVTSLWGFIITGWLVCIHLLLCFSFWACIPGNNGPPSWKQQFVCKIQTALCHQGQSWLQECWSWCSRSFITSDSTGLYLRLKWLLLKEPFNGFSYVFAANAC